MKVARALISVSDKAGVVERGPNARIVTLPSPRFPLDSNYWYFDDEEDDWVCLLEKEALWLTEPLTPHHNAPTPYSEFCLMTSLSTATAFAPALR